MNPVFEVTKYLLPRDTHYCPGCSHGVAHRILMEVLEERGEIGDTIGVSPVGCSITAHSYLDVDLIESPHGRAPAVATGIKRVHPNAPVFTYQGDGDLASIGGNELLHVAERGEKITIIFINNAIYGMTGGQMAPTTLLGMKSTTTPGGRDPEKGQGYPMHMCEILNQLTGPYYLERTTCIDPAHVRKTKAAIKKAFQNQIDGKGFSMVEIVTSCPTNWGLSALKALDFLKDDMLKEYPLGVYRDRSKDEKEAE